MSIIYGIQSVCFYYLSCTPYFEFRNKQNTKAQAKKDTAEKRVLETQQPGLYHHPAPFETNPSWGEEIALGPNLPEKKKAALFKKTSKTSVQEGRKWDDVEAEASNIVKKTCSAGDLCSTRGQNSPTLAGQPSVGGGSILEPLDDNWNHKKGYQRADESLWGVNIRPGDTIRAGHRAVKDAISTAHNSVNNTLRGMEGLLPKFASDERAGKEERHPYFVSRNPPVNDLHPPIVSSATLHKGGMRWMLQPPPSAKVMAGLARVDSDLCSQYSGPRGRSRSGSRASTILPSPALSRAVTEKNFADKIRLGEQQIEGSWTEVIKKRESKMTLASTKAGSLMTVTTSQTTLAASSSTLPAVPASPTKSTPPTSPAKSFAQPRISAIAKPDPAFLAGPPYCELSRNNSDTSTTPTSLPAGPEPCMAGPRYSEIRRAPSISSVSSVEVPRRRSRSPFKRFKPLPSAKADRRLSTDSIDNAPMGLDGARDWHAKEFMTQEKPHRMSKIMKRMSAPELKFTFTPKSPLVEKAEPDYISPTKEEAISVFKMRSRAVSVVREEKSPLVEKTRKAYIPPTKEETRAAFEKYLRSLSASLDRNQFIRDQRLSSSLYSPEEVRRMASSEVKEPPLVLKTRKTYVAPTKEETRAAFEAYMRSLSVSVDRKQMIRDQRFASSLYTPNCDRRMASSVYSRPTDCGSWRSSGWNDIPANTDAQWKGKGVMREEDDE